MEWKLIIAITVVSFLLPDNLLSQIGQEKIPLEWPPAVVYVDDDYDETTPGWNYDHFNSVLTGVRRVREHGVVHVNCGDYLIPTSICIDKPLELTGENRVSTILGSLGEVILDITADSVEVNGFTLQISNTEIHSACIILSADYCSVTGNIITRSPAGYGKGVVIWYGSHNLVRGNVISNAYWGGVQTCSWTEENVVTENLFIGNNTGVWVCCSPGPDYIYHNNFIGNTFNALVGWGFTSETEWDDGYPEGGNFWDDYEGIDEYSGPGQDIPGSDGIGDTPHPIPENDTQDDYPLMNPWIGPGCSIAVGGPEFTVPDLSCGP